MWTVDYTKGVTVSLRGHDNMSLTPIVFKSSMSHTSDAINLPQDKTMVSFYGTTKGRDTHQDNTPDMQPP